MMKPSNFYDIQGLSLHFLVHEYFSNIFDSYIHYTQDTSSLSKSCPYSL
jgi:hypothetical protein